ncbi:hypothetical protein [Psychromonas sp. Urea-02u-13]|uniref:hypothetical protein n=1 Tax=Psychromonas sp. Urea-02u-13 TaxID=2058326 RepID=UPI000C3218AE|nr:hypothetical protein [Psychromonas sp. Urea-02u-13]PKG36909.1 hypothetical protein CXF74_21705 [Psychromonas sp. Urea-02u-13]
MNRVEALEQIITFGGFREEAFGELVNFAFDCEVELFEVNNDILEVVLKKYLSNFISSDELEEWANFIECRDDVNYAKVEGFIYALANPELMGKITDNKIYKMLEVLSAS